MFRKFASLFVIVLMALLSAWAAPQMPEVVPTHWNLKGEVDGYGSPSMALRWLPLMMALLWILAQWASRQVQKQYPKIAISTFNSILFAVTLVIGATHALVIGMTLGWQIDFMSIMVLLVAGLLLLISVTLQVDEPNPYMGFRFPWIMDRPTLWKQVQTQGNRAFFVWSCIAIGFVLINQAVIAIMVLTVGVLLTVLVVGYTSYQQAKAGVM